MWGWLQGNRRKAEQTVVQSVVRSDAEYLRLLQDLLDRLAVEPGYASVLDWSVQRSVKEEELTVWLRGSEGEIPEDLRHRFGWLTGLGQGELTIVAEEIWRADSVITFDFESDNSDDAKDWFGQGVNLAMEGRLEEAIASFDRAVTVEPDLYQAWYNRGYILRNLSRCEEAITSYDQAVAINPDYHEAWNNRGYALDMLGRQEEAITSYNRAIAIDSDYHEAWHNLGCTMTKLGRYEEANTYHNQAVTINSDYHEAWHNQGYALNMLGRQEEAILSYDKAVTIKPDLYEAWLNRGSSLHKLDRYEEAIKSYDRAISFKSDLHQAWSNRGSSLFDLGRYEEALENYQQGLSHLQSTTHPEGWGVLHKGLGQLHYNKGQNSFDNFRLDSRVYYHQALKAFQEAETTLPQFPELHLELIQDFLKVYSALREPEKANNYREQGRELLKQLLNNQSAQQRRKLLAKFNSFRQLEVDILLQQHQLISAIEAAELCKNLCLESLFNALQENVVSPSFPQIQTLLQPRSAIIYWHLSPSALSTFILQPGDNEPAVFHSYDLIELQNWIAQWDKINTVATTPNTANAKKKTIDQDLAPAFATLDWPKLQQILEIDKITQHLQPGITNLTLIPHKDLHRLPLHQFFSQPVTYLPSLQIALNLRQKALTDPAPIVDLIQPPQGSGLSNAEVEIVAIKALFPNGRLLPSSNTTKPEFLEFIGAVGRENTMKDPHPSHLRILHFTGHSQHFARRPQESCLYLNNNETITCPDLATSNLKPYHLIVLSACQTSIANHQSLHDEYIGLVSACLSAGASYTISALWEINDQASSPLFIYFYQQLTQNIPAPQALHNASQWLRHVTNTELSQFYAQLSQHPKLSHQAEVLEKIRVIINTLKEYKPTNRPYQDPYYWAAFTISGIAPKPSD